MVCLRINDSSAEYQFASLYQLVGTILGSSQWIFVTVAFAAAPVASDQVVDILSSKPHKEESHLTKAYL